MASWIHLIEGRKRLVFIFLADYYLFYGSEQKAFYRQWIKCSQLAEDCLSLLCHGSPFRALLRLWIVKTERLISPI